MLNAHSLPQKSLISFQIGGAGSGPFKFVQAEFKPGVKAVTGMEQLSKVGLRYPPAAYGTQMDITEGLKHLDLGRKNKQ